jgi:hypothetical protein
MQCVRMSVFGVLSGRRLVLPSYYSLPIGLLYDVPRLGRDMLAIRLLLGREETDNGNGNGGMMPPAHQLPLAITWEQYLTQILRFNGTQLAAAKPPISFVLAEHHCVTPIDHSGPVVPGGDNCNLVGIPFVARAPLRWLPTPSNFSALMATATTTTSSSSSSSPSPPPPLLSFTGRLAFGAIERVMGPEVESLPQEAKDALAFLMPHMRQEITKCARRMWEQLATQRGGEQDENGRSAAASATASDSPSSSPLRVALHLRTGDLRSRSASVSARLSFAVDWLHARGVSPNSSSSVLVYIATDSTEDDELDDMRRTFPRATIGLPASFRAAQLDSLRDELLSAQPLWFPLPPPSVLEDVLLLLLDKSACVQADLFLGSPGSTFSAVIATMRRRNGLPLHTEALFPRREHT